MPASAVQMVDIASLSASKDSVHVHPALYCFYLSTLGKSIKQYDLLNFDPHDYFVSILVGWNRFPRI